jgi:hypothetical protein
MNVEIKAQKEREQKIEKGSVLLRLNTIDKLELPTRLQKKDKKYKKKSVSLQQGMSFPANSSLFNVIVPFKLQYPRPKGVRRPP